jgi:hypothetical protein
VLDACSTSTVAAPRGVSNDAATGEAWRNELVDSSIAAVGENATVVLGHLLDGRAAVVNGVVTVAWSASLGGDHVKVRTADKDLSVARPPVVL